MKSFVSIVFFQFITIFAFAQQSVIDSLKKELLTAKQDSTQVAMLAALSDQYLYSRPDSALLFGQQGYELAQQINSPKGEALSLNRIANSNINVGNMPKALELLQKALGISERINDEVGIARALNNIGNLYAVQNGYGNALPYFLKAKKYMVVLQSPVFSTIVLQNIADSYSHLDQPDSAWQYIQAAYEAGHEKYPDALGDVLRIAGDIQMQKNNPNKALGYYRESLVYSERFVDIDHLSISYLSIAKLFNASSQLDSAVFYGKQSLDKAQSGGFMAEILSAGKFLSETYEKNNQYADAFRYYKIATDAKDSLFSQEKVKQMLSLAFDEKTKQQEIAAANSSYRYKLGTYLLLGGLLVLLLVAIILIRNNRHRQKAFVLLQKQKAETDTQKIKAEGALHDLKITQAQLIQSEKMASLGELTAGVAHEIQNPLNFVNNFSELNKEMLEELKAERLKPNAERDDDLQNNLIKDVISNEEKINHHGKRADAIVKGMLQHSRQSSSKKEPTDINALCDEYLRLSYHGLRAKDKSFNADFKTDFDQRIGKINVIPQDIGRVLLNLCNNAFYAVSEKQKLEKGNYKPEVEVETEKADNKIIIHVCDNGNGIPQNIIDKIFQPFFTTKPTGSGTGLGLSLSYDIIKSHGGEIKVESKEGEGSEFIIVLPF